MGKSWHPPPCSYSQQPLPWKGDPPRLHKTLVGGECTKAEQRLVNWLLQNGPASQHHQCPSMAWAASTASSHLG